MNIVWTARIDGPPIEPGFSNVAWSYFGSGDTPKAALADLRKRVEGYRDDAVTEAQQKLEHAAFVLACEALL